MTDDSEVVACPKCGAAGLNDGTPGEWHMICRCGHKFVYTIPEPPCTCTHYVVDHSDPEPYHPENVDREDDPNCPVHGGDTTGPEGDA
jgi:hypothetical protein